MKVLNNHIFEKSVTAADLEGSTVAEVISQCVSKMILPWERIFKGNNKREQAREAAKFVCRDINPYTGIDSPHKYVMYYDAIAGRWIQKARSKWLEQMVIYEKETINAIDEELKKNFPISELSWRPYRNWMETELVIMFSKGFSANIYEPSLIEPKQGDVRPFIEHIDYLCDGNTEHREHILDWFAWKVQNPTQKLKHALVIGSKNEGTGKTFLTECLADILGHQNCSTGNLKQVTGDKTDFLHRKELVVVEELRDMKASDANKLKQVITNDSIGHDLKFKQIKASEPNYCDFIFTTNYEDALYTVKGGRRYFFIFSNAEKKPQSYFNSLFMWRDNGGLEALADFLLQRDLSKFSASAPPPITEALKRTMEFSKSGLENILEEKIAGIAALTNSQAREAINGSGVANSNDPSKVGQALRRLGYSVERKIIQGSKHTIYYLEKSISISDAVVLVSKKLEQGLNEF